ncbi:hypothetical protein [Thiothrix unzii]|uniref:DUF2946 domain-containing protein n=1 Tax=Thiothrix unzii TaxID=111769 RepID=A0A975FB47_9GAMM|nr:hypothetical protein [Thiothrix unzii]QTR54715.1 hypothetical protein J9260_06400 [Thiothrix unzii]
MRKHIVTFLILLMAALPVWSASMVCHHVQTMPQMMSMMDAQATNHHCCLEMQKQQSTQVSADTCHCDQLQHAQFVLSLPMLPAAVPPDSFIPQVFSPQVLPEAADVPYRPPIA